MFQLFHYQPMYQKSTFSTSPRIPNRSIVISIIHLVVLQGTGGHSCTTIRPSYDQFLQHNLPSNFVILILSSKIDNTRPDTSFQAHLNHSFHPNSRHPRENCRDIPPHSIKKVYCPHKPDTEQVRQFSLWYIKWRNLMSCMLWDGEKGSIIVRTRQMALEPQIASSNSAKIRNNSPCQPLMNFSPTHLYNL